MIKKIVLRLKSINPWHFLWIGILCSEILGVLLNTLQSYLWWGFLSRDLLFIGLIDGLFVPLLVTPIIIYFVLHAEKLEELNKELQLEIVKVKRSEEKILRESEARYRSIVEDQTEFINRFLPDGTVTFVNEACCRYLGISRDELSGHSFFPMLPEGDRGKLQSLLSSLSVENPVGTIQHQVIKPDGSVVWQQWTNRAIFDDNGSLVEFQAVGRDITKLKLAEQALLRSEELFRTLVETMNEGLGKRDENGIITYVNEKLCNMLGYSCGEMIGRHVYSFHNEENLQILKEQMASRKTGEKRPYEIQWTRKDGQKMDMLVSPQPIFDESGVYRGSFAVFTDITERKRNEELIRAYKDRLSQLTSRLSLVEEKERRKVAMDLHDNIGQILACAYIMLRDLQKSASGDLGDSLEEIRSLMEQSIKYTRSLTFELSTPLLYEIGLEPAVEWLGQEFQKKHGIEFRLTDDGTDKPLRDETRILIFQSIRELLTNVVKHARARSVTVTLERKDGSIRASVEDDGTGFDVGQVYDGSYMKCGFGLFSVRERLKNIGGSLDIESAPGSSTRITLTIPLEKKRETGDVK